MNPQNRKARIIWNCRRGMLELDLILSKFMSNHFDKLDSNQAIQLEQLLEVQDPVLYAWLAGQEEPEKEFDNIVKLIRSRNQP